MDTVTLLDLSFNNLSVPEAVTRLLERNPALPFAYVVTPNADHIARLRRFRELIPVYQGAWLCLLDSHVIANVAGLFGVPAPQVSTGTDVTALLLSSLLTQDVAIIGFSEAYLAALRDRCPATNFILHTPPMNLLQNPEAFTAARDFAVKTRARFTLIGLGSPLQELLAQAIAAHPNSTGIGLCIGAALEFCAGVKPRAPAWMQRAGLEWLHRLVRDPRRLSRRYLIDNPPVLLSLVREAFRVPKAQTVAGGHSARARSVSSSNDSGEHEDARTRSAQAAKKFTFDGISRACESFAMPDAFGQTSSDSALWAVVAVMGKIIRIAEIYPNRNAALADQAWRESQVRAYAGFLDSASQPFPRYAVKAIRRTDLPRRWKPLPALGFLRGQMF